MTNPDRQTMQTVDNNFSSVVRFLNSTLQPTSVHLVETPCYIYLGRDSKLEVTVFANPGIGTIDVRLMKLNSDDKEPFFEHSYDLKGLSIPTFKREIDDLIFRCNHSK